MTDEHDRPSLPGLERFGAELAAAAQRRGTMRRHGVSRRLGLALAAGCLVLVAAVGAGFLIGHESSRDPARATADPAQRAPIVVTAPDPGGSLPWAARIYTSADGSECIVAGRLNAGRLGRLVRGVFRPLPREALAMCGQLDPRRFFYTTVRADGEPSRSLLYGRAGEDIKALSIAAGGKRDVRVGPGGAFLVVFEDDDAEPGDVLPKAEF